MEGQSFSNHRASVNYCHSSFTIQETNIQKKTYMRGFRCPLPYPSWVHHQYFIDGQSTRRKKDTVTGCNNRFPKQLTNIQNQNTLRKLGPKPTFGQKKKDDHHIFSERFFFVPGDWFHCWPQGHLKAER